MSAVQDAITQAAQEEGVDPAFALAVADRESSFNPNVRNSRSIYGLFQMRGDLRSQYGAGDSSDPYTQTKAWARFINATKAGLAQRIGREPTNDELYLAHYFGEGRAARLIGGHTAPSTNVADVFTPTELAANPNIAKAGTVGNLMGGISADMEARQAKYGGPQTGTDFAQFGQPDSGPSPSDAAPSTTNSGAQPIDFAQYGNRAQGDSTPIDFSSFGVAQGDQGNSQTGPSAQGAGGMDTMSGIVGMTADMPLTLNGRPSTNVEDDRNTSVLGKLANKFSSQMAGTWENPDTAGQEVDVSQFGLPDTGAALSALPQPEPQVPVGP